MADEETDETPAERAPNEALERLKKRIRAARAKVDRLKLERKEINADIGEARAGMEAEGIHKEAFDLALKYAGWDTNKRRGFDRAYAIVREALELEIEPDLFSYKDGVLPQRPPKKADAPPAGNKPVDQAAAQQAEAKPGEKKAARPRNKPKADPPTPAELAAGDKRKQQQEREQREGAALLDDGRPVTH